MNHMARLCMCKELECLETPYCGIVCTLTVEDSNQQGQCSGSCAMEG